MLTRRTTLGWRKVWGGFRWESRGWPALLAPIPWRELSGTSMVSWGPPWRCFRTGLTWFLTPNWLGLVLSCSVSAICVSCGICVEIVWFAFEVLIYGGLDDGLVLIVANLLTCSSIYWFKLWVMLSFCWFSDFYVLKFIILNHNLLLITEYKY